MSFKPTIFCAWWLILLLMMASLPYSCFAQETAAIRTLESSLKQLYGLEKLKAYNQLTAYYAEEGARKAFKYGRLAVAHGENVFDGTNPSVDRTQHYRLIIAYMQLGVLQYDREHYVESKKHLEAAKALSFLLGNTTYLAEVEQYLAGIDSLVDGENENESFFAKKIDDLNIGRPFNKASKDVKIRAEIGLAELSEKKKNYQKAYGHYEKAVALLKSKGDQKGITRVQLKMAVLLDSLNKHDEVERILDNAITEIEAEEERLGGNIAFEDGLHHHTPSTLKLKQKELKDLSEKYAGKDDRKSLTYFKLYQELSQKMENDSLRRLIEKRHRTNEIFLLKLRT